MGQINEFKIIDLKKICEFKVDIVKAIDQRTALLIFVYDSDNIHNLFQLLVWRDQVSKQLLWRMYRNNEFSKIFRSIGELREIIGNVIKAEIDNKNIRDELADSVTKGEISEHELEIINAGGVRSKLDKAGLAEFAQEQMAKDPTIKPIPGLLNNKN